MMLTNSTVNKLWIGGEGDLSTYSNPHHGGLKNISFVGSDWYVYVNGYRVGDFAYFSDKTASGYAFSQPSFAFVDVAEPSIVVPFYIW